MLGHKHTPEARARMSTAVLRRFEDPAEREKIAAALRGRTLSDEHRANLSAAKWRGDDVGYDAIHVRVRKVLMGLPCAHAGDTCKGRLEDAFDHDTPPEFVRIDQRGRRYSVRVEDYMRLCKSHHTRCDNAHSAEPAK